VTKALDEKQLAQRKANLEKLPEIAYTIEPASGRLIVVKSGETGYWPYRDPKTRQFVEGREAVVVMHRLNAQAGVTWQQRESMTLGSIFGFHAPGADVDHYTGEDPFLTDPDRYVYPKPAKAV
jgi:hypothetical protein